MASLTSHLPLIFSNVTAIFPSLLWNEIDALALDRREISFVLLGFSAIGRNTSTTLFVPYRATHSGVINETAALTSPVFIAFRNPSYVFARAGPSARFNFHPCISKHRMRRTFPAKNIVAIRVLTHRLGLDLVDVITSP